MVLQQFFKKENKENHIGHETYSIIVSNSKNFMKNNDYFINKNFLSSFEILSCFLIFYLKAIKKNKVKNFKVINQSIIDNFILDLDNTLRENGIGDMSIGKYVKSYIKKFYFRLPKIDKIIENMNKEDFIIYLKELKFIHNDKINIVSDNLFKSYVEINKYVISRKY